MIKSNFWIAEQVKIESLYSSCPQSVSFLFFPNQCKIFSNSSTFISTVVRKLIESHFGPWMQNAETSALLVLLLPTSNYSKPWYKSNNILRFTYLSTFQNHMDLLINLTVQNLTPKHMWRVLLVIWGNRGNVVWRTYVDISSQWRRQIHTNYYKQL